MFPNYYSIGMMRTPEYGDGDKTAYIKKAK